MKTKETTDESRVKRCADGKYRWVYEVPMLKNPSILFDVYKVLGISFGIVWLFGMILIGCEEGFDLDSLWGSTSVFLIVMLIFAVIGYIGYFIVGAAAGKPGTVGAGLLAASRTTSTSELANVARLIPCRRMNLIKVNQLLNKNRVFVPDEDFDFVYDFLCQHCPKAKK